MIRAGLIAGYLATLLAVDTQVELPGQLALETDESSEEDRQRKLGE